MNSAMGTVANTVIRKHTGWGGKSIKAILVEFDIAQVSMTEIQQSN